MEKVCKRCNKQKDIDDFAKSKAEKDGHCFYCKVCSNEKRAMYYAEKQSKIITIHPALPENSILVSALSGFETVIGYAINNKGYLFSCKNGSGKLLRNVWVKLNTGIDSKGYPIFGCFINKKRKYYRIHRMVGEAFVSNPDNKPEINHKDRIRTNNWHLNLEWCNRSENIQHAFDVLNHVRLQGTLAPAAKLNEDNVKKIHSDLAMGLSIRKTAKKYGVHHSIISGIKCGKRWSHVIPLQA